MCRFSSGYSMVTLGLKSRLKVTWNPLTSSNMHHLQSGASLGERTGGNESRRQSGRALRSRYENRRSGVSVRRHRGMDSVALEPRVGDPAVARNEFRDFV